MDRRYCSRCLQTFAGPGPDACSRETCRRPRPSRGWPGFLDFGESIDDRYEVQRILGAGGAGVTYRCVDRFDDEVAAVKILHADRKRGTLANRLAIEGEVLELLDHPHIVPFRALKLHGEGHYYLATLHMVGGSLDGWIRRHGPMSPEGAVVVGRQLGMALDYVHTGGIVHRDLKPANVLLEEGDRDHPVIRLADFGIARLFREQQPVAGLTRTGAFIGTPEYAAPEQVRGEKGIGPAADAFATGALLHFVASGTALYRREDIHDWKAFRDRDWDPADRPRLVDLVHCEAAEGREALGLLDEVIDALMHPDPAMRLDMATAAMRLGANPAQLAPVDQPAFSPPSLITSTCDGLDEDLEALVPIHEIDEDAITRSDPVEPALRQALGPADADEMTLEAQERAEPPGPSPAGERRPLDLAVMEELPVPTRDASEDWSDEDLAWPTREVRRNRVHGAFAVAAALLVGLALAWPGGPTRLVGEERLASLGATFAALGERLKVEQTSYLAQDAALPPPLEEAPSDAPAAPPVVTPRPTPAPQASRPSTRRSQALSTPVRQARQTSSGPTPAPTARRPAPRPELASGGGRAGARGQPDAPPRTADEGHDVRVVRVSLTTSEGRGDASASLETPPQPELPLLDPADFIQPADGSVSAVDAWAADPDDKRELGEVLAEEGARIARRIPGEIQREQLSAADERWRRYVAEAAVAEARLARKTAEWDRVLEEARSQAEAAEERQPASDPVHAWDERGDADLLEVIFRREPRVAPRD